ncbi:hypothetical protein [Chitinophaga niabensis]|uniref:Uncharacterized protein n=1 Tax=Chitinophaga niabensis TaxID=536979 RepID=A0A1N6G6P0_9BACT|nr:hypothetical protein [Chitinophaga niabensis]SIO03200.1 hypothetical protein SAMN04488055_2610 [Chitinophaga niabensis]
MKVVVMKMLLMMLSFSTYAQVKVRITDWTRKVAMFANGYWDNKWADEVIRQIGADEFDKVKMAAGKQIVPKEMRTIKSIVLKDTAGLFKHLNELNMYKIATYSSVGSTGKVFEMAILKVPYRGNEDWDANAKWDVLYFFIENRFVEERK